MAYLNKTKELIKKSETIYYVNGDNGNDSYSGIEPDLAFATIGAAITACTTGDTIVVSHGTYTETGLDLDENAVEMYFEIGTIIQPSSGTALTISGNYCQVKCGEGAVLIYPAASQTGVLVTGDFVYLEEIRVKCDSSASIGFDLQGNVADLRMCRVSNPLTAAFKIQGNKIKVTSCCTGGSSGDTSIGFWLTKTRICGSCQSEGHETAGLQIDSGCTNYAIIDFSSGGGDGKWINNGSSGTISNLSFDSGSEFFNSSIYTTTTFSGGTTANIFKVTGAIRLIDIEGEVTTVLPSTSSNIHLEAYSSNASVDITDSPGPDVSGLVVGAMLMRLADSTENIDIGNPSSTPAILENTGGTLFNPSAKNAVNVIKDNGADTYIRLVLSSGLASGAIRWSCRWYPLSIDGFLESV